MPEGLRKDIKMKKLIALLLILTLSLTVLASCNIFSGNENEQNGASNENSGTEDNTVIRIGYMQGPTGMGMAKLIHDNGGAAGNQKYQFTKFEDASKATAALLSGSIDMACLPTNNAAIIYNTKNAAAQVLALNCLNSLFLLTKSGTEITSFEDLEGKTIYTISNGTPKVILQHILNEKGINATIATEAVINGDTKALAQPSNLASAMIAGAVDIALVPEPVATAAPLQVANQNKGYTYKVALDITDVWETISENPIAMGCIVGRTDFVKEHKNITDAFLAEYKSSIEFIANKENIDTSAAYIVEAGVLGAAGPAKKSLTNLGNAISYVDGEEMKKVLIDFYNSINVNLIGGKLPDDNFYYKK